MSQMTKFTTREDFYGSTRVGLYYKLFGRTVRNRISLTVF